MEECNKDELCLNLLCTEHPALLYIGQKRGLCFGRENGKSYRAIKILHN